LAGQNAKICQEPIRKIIDKPVVPEGYLACAELAEVKPAPGFTSMNSVQARTFRLVYTELVEVLNAPPQPSGTIFG